MTRYKAIWLGGNRSGLVMLAAVSLLAACASGTARVPYPAFVQADDLEGAFMAGLPGVRAKQFQGDARSHRSSSRLLIPADWEFSTGAAPDMSVEIFVLAGEIEVGGISLRAGGYAYLPSGSMGASMRSRSGAHILYFLSEVDDRAVIQVPLITGMDSATWEPVSDEADDFGLSEMVLRSDPGSGARTWLLKIDPVAQQAWQAYSADIEGYLIKGNYQHSECVDGKPVSDVYHDGGYFLRPAGAVNAGPAAKATVTTIWFLRSPRAGERQLVGACIAPQ
jgi:hypothetical protein